MTDSERSKADKKRIALIIGNTKYEFANPLKNPANDVNTISYVLEKLRFEVLLKKDLNLKDFKIAIQEFGSLIKDYETVLFFFAGHGLQVNGVNYLIPIDANPNGENQVDFESINANWILSLLEDGSADVNIVILDACRTNPFKRSWNRAPTREGLSFLSAPKGTLISYSTAPDKTASDGLGDNSPFTSALAEEIINPTININQLFQIVRSKVIKATDGNQVPWESTSLLSDFHFNNGQYFSIETFCAGLLYNKEKDRVLNNLLLDINSFERLRDFKLKISDEDRNAGVLEVFIKRAIKIFDVFESIEYKLYRNGQREYIFFVNNMTDSKLVFDLANSIYRKLGVGLYDDERHHSFREHSAIQKIAAKKAKSDRDQCFTSWSFDRISFFLQYRVEPPCQFILTVKFNPDRKVLPQSIFDLLKFKITNVISDSVEVDRIIKDGRVHSVDYEVEVREPELKIFKRLGIKIFDVEKKFEYSISMNLTLKTTEKVNLDDIEELVATLVSIYGPDRSGSGYLEGWERDTFAHNRYWSGRSWDFNLQHQSWDPDSTGEMSLYHVYLSYDGEMGELELVILSFNNLVEWFNEAIVN